MKNTGRTMIIDGDNTRRGGDAILALLDSLDISRLNNIVNSHYDADHLRGITKIPTNGIRADTVFGRGPVDDPTTIVYQEYAVAVYSIRHTVEPGNSFNFGSPIKAVI